MSSGLASSYLCLGTTHPVYLFLCGHTFTQQRHRGHTCWRLIQFHIFVRAIMSVRQLIATDQNERGSRGQTWARVARTAHEIELWAYGIGLSASSRARDHVGLCLAAGLPGQSSPPRCQVVGASRGWKRLKWTRTGPRLKAVMGRAWARRGKRRRLVDPVVGTQGGLWL